MITPRTTKQSTETWARRTTVLVASLAALVSGCAATASAKFSPDVATVIQRDSMRRLETDRLVIYYPDGRRDTALRTAERVQGCLNALLARAQIKNGFATQKMVLVMPDLALNNAMVFPLFFREAAAVIPTQTTWDTLSVLGFPLDPAVVGCHEFTHYVQNLQVAGFWRVMDAVFGDVLTPQLGLDNWFWEGLATYYESRLQPGVGRMGAFWDGYFHAGVAGRRLNGGDLSQFKRDFSFGRDYIVGSRFIEFLVDRYGEERLWRLIEVQGRSIMFLLGINLRFKQVYDKTLSTLIDEFAAYVAANYPVRERPAGQRLVRPLGTDARYAVGRDGTEAVITSDLDQPLRLTVYGPDGRQLRRLNLHDIVLPRRILLTDTHFVSGLSVTDDGKKVFFAVVDRGPTFSQTKLLRYDVEADRLEVAHSDLGGPGGGVDGTGRFFLFTRPHDDRHDVVELDLSSGRTRIIAQAQPGGYFSAPRPSPDGQRVVAVHWDTRQAALVVLDRSSGKRLAFVAGTGGIVLDPHWVDDHRIAFSGESEQRSQVFVHDLNSGVTTPVTRAPYMALSPQPVGQGGLRFLNRQGWGWTVDEVALAAGTSPQATGLIPGARLIAASYQEPLGAAASGRAGAPSPVSSPNPAAASASPVVISDRPYSPWEKLLVPQMRSVDVTFATNQQRDTRVIGSASLGGTDRLSYHSWALSGALDFGTRKGSFGFDYVNSQLAPFTVSTSLSQRSWTEDVATPGAMAMGDPASTTTATDRFARGASLDISRHFFTHQASLGFRMEEDRLGQRRRQMGGPSASLALNAFETTPYAGARRGLWLESTAAIYPDALTSAGSTFANLGGSLSAVAPIPGFQRPTLSLQVRGRGIFGAPAGTGLLQVGGLGAAPLFRSSNRPEGPVGKEIDTLPGLGQTFFEPLRGYEDYALTLDRVALADLSLSYPIIVDRGSASTLGVLPAMFLRQFELEGFGSGAWDTQGGSRGNYHAAVGGAVSMRFTVWLAPLTLSYQFSHRLVDDQASVHLVQLGL